MDPPSLYLVNGLKKRLMKTKGAWTEELPTILWSYRTTARSGTGETPFSLTYGTEVVLLLEILSESLQVTGFDVDTNEVERQQDLDMLYEKCEAAQLRQAAYKARAKTYTTNGCG